jgi:hypothetical protein
MGVFALEDALAIQRQRGTVVLCLVSLDPLRIDLIQNGRRRTLNLPPQK